MTELHNLYETAMQILEKTAALGMTPEAIESTNVSAVLTDRGNIYTGLNGSRLQNGIPSKTCSEYEAVTAMMMSGENRIIGIVSIAFKNRQVVVPCDSCRELICRINPNNITCGIMTDENTALSLQMLISGQTSDKKEESQENSTPESEVSQKKSDVNGIEWQTDAEFWGNDDSEIPLYQSEINTPQRADMPNNNQPEMMNNLNNIPVMNNNFNNSMMNNNQPVNNGFYNNFNQGNMNNFNRQQNIMNNGFDNNGTFVPPPVVMNNNGMMNNGQPMMNNNGFYYNNAMNNGYNNSITNGNPSVNNGGFYNNAMNNMPNNNQPVMNNNGMYNNYNSPQFNNQPVMNNNGYYSNQMSDQNPYDYVQPVPPSTLQRNAPASRYSNVSGNIYVHSSITSRNSASINSMNSSRNVGSGSVNSSNGDSIYKQKLKDLLKTDTEISSEDDESENIEPSTVKMDAATKKAAMKAAKENKKKAKKNFFGR